MNTSNVKSLRGARVEILKGLHQGKKGTISSFNITKGKREVIVRIDGFRQVENYPADDFKDFFRVIDKPDDEATKPLPAKMKGKPASEDDEDVKPLSYGVVERLPAGKFIAGDLKGWEGVLLERRFDSVKVLLTVPADGDEGQEEDLDIVAVNDIVVSKFPHQFEEFNPVEMTDKEKEKAENKLWDEMVNDPKRVHHLNITINARMKTQLIIFVPGIERYDEENENTILDLLIHAVKRKVEEQGGIALSRFRDYIDEPDPDEDDGPVGLDEDEENEEEEEEDLDEDYDKDYDKDYDS